MVMPTRGWVIAPFPSAAGRFPFVFIVFANRSERAALARARNAPPLQNRSLQTKNAVMRTGAVEYRPRSFIDYLRRRSSSRHSLFGDFGFVEGEHSAPLLRQHVLNDWQIQ